MKRKLIASLMTATMIAGMLTGCGSGSSTDDSAKTDDTKQEETAEAGTDESSSGDEADVNEDGTVNNPEAVKVDENKLVFWSLFAGGDGEYMDKSFPITMLQILINRYSPLCWYGQIIIQTADGSGSRKRAGYWNFSCI